MAIPLLASAVVFSWIGFHTPQEGLAHAQDRTPSRNVQSCDPLAGSPAERHTAGDQDVAVVSDPAKIRFDVRAVSKTQPGSETGYEMRSEMREFSTSIADLYRGDSSPPDSLRFPLFDGRFVRLKALRHQSVGADQGVVFAEADGELEGGHVLLSYVGTALAGMIHLPYRGEFYEIRTAPDGRSHILTQLDPAKMPVCGVCPQH